jgi:hypothetical protein
MSTTLRRLLYLAVVLNLCLLGAFARAAHATVIPADCTSNAPYCDSQGYRYRNLGGSDNGVRAYLAGSGHTNHTGTVLGNVAMESSLSDPLAGFIQAGEVQYSSDWLGQCGQGVTVAMVEYVPQDSNTYHCPVHDAISPFGSGGGFSVRYSNGAWESWRDGSKVWTASSSLGFTSGYSLAFNESWVNPSNGGQALAMTYGPSGHTAWGFSTDGGATWSQIVTSLAYNDDSDGDSDGDWSMGGSPSPFNLNWGGF